MAKRKKFSDRLRQLQVDSKVSIYRISKDTGIDVATLSRFVNGHRFLSVEALDALADYLGWEVKRKK